MLLPIPLNGGSTIHILLCFEPKTLGTVRSTAHPVLLMAHPAAREIKQFSEVSFLSFDSKTGQS
jgi:hypothetical protein